MYGNPRMQNGIYVAVNGNGQPSAVYIETLLRIVFGADITAQSIIYTQNSNAENLAHPARRK